MLLLDASYSCTITEYLSTPTHAYISLRPPPPSTASTATSMMSSRSQITSGPTSKVALSSDRIFELNQAKAAKRAKLARESEALRICTCPSVPNVWNWILNALSSSFVAFLEWPTVEGLEAFVEKRVEYDDTMEDHVSDLQAVIREQLVFVQGLNRAAKLAEERRLQEFRSALEQMDPSEAEAARQTERERSLRLQREREARAAALDAEWARIRAGIRAKYDSVE